MERKWTSYLLSAVASVALMLVSASGARAQAYQDAEFNKFLSNHPGVAIDLRANPGLINDPAFRAQHPELQQYLQTHQRVSATVRGQAAQMNGERAANSAYNGGWSKGSNPDPGASDGHRSASVRQWWHKNHRD